MESGRAWGARARVSDYSDAARGPGCPGAPPSRLASPAQHTRPHLHRPRGPTHSTPARGWWGAARAGWRDLPPDPLPGDAGMRCSRREDQLNHSALPSPRWNEQSTGCTPRFLFVTGNSWKGYRLCLVVNIKVQSSFVLFFKYH